jgi:hypothetical protein
MKYFLCLLLSAATVTFAANVGDTYEQVVAEKGAPKSQITAGTLRILKYPDVRIEIRNNVVVSIKPVTAAPLASSPSLPAPAPADTREDPIAKAKKELADAVLRIQRIVNQPASVQPISTGMNVTTISGGWFHEATLKPDFDNVDIRLTQKLTYDRFEYVTSDLNPGLAFTGSDLESNPMTKFFYTDLSLPKKKLSESEMLEINRLYRIIGRCQSVINPAPSPKG